LGCKWSSESVGNITELVRQLTDDGVDTCVRADGDNRPDCKRASTAKREKARIAAFALRSDTSNTSHALQNDSLTQDERTVLQEKLSDLEQKLKTKENACRKLIGHSFASDLFHSLSELKLSRNSVNESDEQGEIRTVKAKLQLDPVLIERALSKKSDVIISSDSDYSAMLEKDGLQISFLKYSSRTRTLWTGAVSDTDFLNRAGVLELQHDFVKKDEVNGKYIPFTNILDKGYRSVLAAWRCGKLLVLQPTFAKSDTKFTGEQTLSSSAIAADRASNERAVRLCKKAGMLQRGVESNSSCSTIAVG